MLEKYKQFYYYTTKDPTERPDADGIREGGKFKTGVHQKMLAQDIGLEVMGLSPENTVVMVWMVAEDSQDVACFEVSIEAFPFESRDLDGFPL
jgi:hypothetical protein